MRRNLGAVTAVAASALLAAAVFAQDRSVSRNTRVRPQPRPLPVMINYTVASPRATLATVPPMPVADDTAEVVPCPRTIGAACNFARESGRVITVRQGTSVHVGLSRAVEGVWYERAIGWLGTLIIVELQNPWQPDRWFVLGRDGAADLRRGPSIGTVSRRLGVRDRIPRPGVYRMRARVYTYALPVPLNDQSPSRDDLRPYGDVACNTITFTLRILGLGVEQVEEIPEEYEPAEQLPLENEILNEIIE